MDIEKIDIEDLRQTVKRIGITMTNKKMLPPRKFIGHAVLNSVEETFEFEVPARADEEEVYAEMVDSFWESGLVDVWCEEVEKEDGNKSGN